MGAYVYRLEGKSKFDLVDIDGKKEKVFHLKYWWKPGSGTWWCDEFEPRDYRVVTNRLKREFKDEPVRFIRLAHSLGIFKVTHDNFTDVRDDQLGFGCYPEVEHNRILRRESK